MLMGGWPALSSGPKLYAPPAAEQPAGRRVQAGSTAKPRSTAQHAGRSAAYLTAAPHSRTVTNPRYMVCEQWNSNVPTCVGVNSSVRSSVSLGRLEGHRVGRVRGEDQLVAAAHLAELPEGQF